MATVKLLTPTGRTSFLKVYKAEPNMKGDKLIFSCKLMFPKDTNMDWIKSKWKEACIEEFGVPEPPALRPIFAAGDPFDDKGAILDGDWKYANVAEEKKEGYEAYRGMWVMGFNCAENRPPAVVDENKDEIINPGDFQSGDFARIVAELSSFTDKKFKRPQMSVKLIVIQKVRSGERFSSGMSKESALSMLGDEPIADSNVDDLM